MSDTKHSINIAFLWAIVFVLLVALIFLPGVIYKVLIGIILLSCLFFAVLHYMHCIPLLNSVILDQSLPSGTGDAPEVSIARSELVGRYGSALTDLRPAGIMLLDGKRVDVVTTGSYIKRGSEVRIVSENGTEIVVEQVTD